MDFICKFRFRIQQIRATCCYFIMVMPVKDSVVTKWCFPRWPDKFVKSGMRSQKAILDHFDPGFSPKMVHRSISGDTVTLHEGKKLIVWWNKQKRSWPFKCVKWAVVIFIFIFYYAKFEIEVDAFWLAWRMQVYIVINVRLFQLPTNHMDMEEV